MTKKLGRAVKAEVLWHSRHGVWMADSFSDACPGAGFQPCYIVPAAEYERLTKSAKAAKRGRRGKSNG